MNVRELTVDDTHYFMKRVKDNKGGHYVKDGVTAVLDFQETLVIGYKNTESHVHPLLLQQIRQDRQGNNLVAIPLATDIVLFMRGLLYIDTPFVKQLEGTSLHELVKNKEGCYAVSGFEIIEDITLDDYCVIPEIANKRARAP